MLKKKILKNKKMVFKYNCFISNNNLEIIYKILIVHYLIALHFLIFPGFNYSGKFFSFFI